MIPLRKTVGRAASKMGAAFFSIFLIILVSATWVAFPLENVEGAGVPVLSRDGGAAPSILVGLFRAASFTVSSQSPLTLLAGANAGPVAVPANSEVTFAVLGAGLYWEVSGGTGAVRKGQSAGPVLLTSPSQSSAGGASSAGADQPSAGASSSPVIVVKRQTSASASFTGASFRGGLLALQPSGNPPGAILAANVVSMEDYVQSVVGGEMPSDWPIEALKAQAIAARSYAAYRIGLAIGSSLDYEKEYGRLTWQDIRIWASDQVYRGVGEEDPETVEATQATRGLVLTYAGKAADACFFSDAGGMTEDAKYVWGGSVPYLQAVKEVPHTSPYSSWTATLEPSALAAGLGRVGVTVGPAPDILVGVEPGLSGRWSSIAVGTAGGSPQLVKASTFRVAFPEVKSMLFSLFTVVEGRPVEGQIGAQMDVYAVSAGSLGTLVKVGESVILGADGSSVANPRGAFALGGAPASGSLRYIIQGKGWGHGVGLSQYGAKAMAETGKSAQDIVSFYFPGTSLERWWQ